MQIDMDFTVTHNQNAGNNQILEENRQHFNGQAKIVFDLLMQGEEVTSVKMLSYQILDLRARIFSIQKRLGIDIPERKIPGGHGQKAWKLTEEQIKSLQHGKQMA